MKLIKRFLNLFKIKKKIGIKDSGFPLESYGMVFIIDDEVEVVQCEYLSSEKPGLGGTIINLYLSNSRFKRNYLIESANGVQAYVTADPELVTFALVICWKYKILLEDINTFCPVSELRIGVKWTGLKREP